MLLQKVRFPKEDAKLSKKELKREKSEEENILLLHMNWQRRFRKKTDKEVSITVPGHTQRGGSPCSYDRVFATRVGAKAEY